MDPSSLRRHCRSLRNSLPEAERKAAADAVAESLRVLLAPVPPGTIGSYLTADGEVDLLPAKALIEPLGWNFALPVVGPEASMRFRIWNSASLMIPNRFGIPEPDPRSEELDPADLDIVLMPCVAVDRSGNRLGMGAGYYDRAFAGRRGGPVLIAVAYDVQLLAQLDVNEWDVPADVVVTETRVIDTRVGGN